MIAAKEKLKEVITQYDEFKNREDKIQRLKYMRNLIKVYHNFEKDYFNIFTTSLIIHQKLYYKY